MSRYLDKPVRTMTQASLDRYTTATKRASALIKAAQKSSDEKDIENNIKEVDKILMDLVKAHKNLN